MVPSLNGMGNGTASVKDSLVLDKVEKRYGDFVALEPTDLTIKAGEFITLLGPSGSGKTTILMSIAGFVAPSSGRMLLDGRDVTGLPPERRNFGVVFQGYALFPHLTVYDNVAFPLRARGITGEAARPKIMAALEMAKLQTFAHRYPRELSGGQQQRVALARALVYNPPVLLMDEPLSALDKKLREEIQFEIRRIHQETGVTILYVTHDQEEALRLSDRIAVFSQGEIDSTVLGLIDSVMEELDGRKLVVFCNHVMTTERLVAHLAKHNPACLYGKTKDRQVELDKFVDDPSCKVIVMNIAAGGAGVDRLQEVCRDMLFVELPYTAANFRQATARLHRDGQKNGVNCRIAIANKTLQHRIWEMVQEKDTLVNLCIRGPLGLREALAGR